MQNNKQERTVITKTSKKQDRIIKNLFEYI